MDNAKTTYNSPGCRGYQGDSQLEKKLGTEEQYQAVREADAHFKQVNAKHVVGQLMLERYPLYNMQNVGSCLQYAVNTAKEYAQSKGSGSILGLCLRGALECARIIAN